jgi:hypothetical protein
MERIPYDKLSRNLTVKQITKLDNIVKSIAKLTKPEGSFYDDEKIKYAVYIFSEEVLDSKTDKESVDTALKMWYVLQEFEDSASVEMSDTIITIRDIATIIKTC